MKFLWLRICEAALVATLLVAVWAAWQFLGDMDEGARQHGRVQQ